MKKAASIAKTLYKSDPRERALHLLREQLSQGFTEDELLIPIELAIEILKTNIMYSNIYTEPSLTFTPIVKIYGVRIGSPCFYCGRRKPNKGKHSCDGCGSPLG